MHVSRLQRNSHFRELTVKTVGQMLASTVPQFVALSYTLLSGWLLLGLNIESA